jgi:uncharacterized membrane protein (DUF4010 family)
LDSISLWPYLPTFQCLALALAIGLFAGLEREHRGKEARLRTFAFIALIGCVGALLGESFALLSVGLTGVLGQRLPGHAGFYFVSIVVGIASSASAVASAALLAAHDTITPSVVAIGAILATAVSVLVNVPFAARVSRDTGLRKHPTLTMSTLSVLGVVGVIVQNALASLMAHL